MAVSASSLSRLADQVCDSYSWSMRFFEEFRWADDRQIDHYGPRTFDELREELLGISKRCSQIRLKLNHLSWKASEKVDTPEFRAEVEQARKDAKAWLKDCEAWLSDARVAIPYKLGVDGRPLGKE